jgi:hypothetical protein
VCTVLSARVFASREFAYHIVQWLEVALIKVVRQRHRGADSDFPLIRCVIARPRWHDGEPVCAGANIAASRAHVNLPDIPGPVYWIFTICDWNCSTVCGVSISVAGRDEGAFGSLSSRYVRVQGLV